MATLSDFRLITDRLIEQHGGRICGTAGDSILAAFGSALAAVQCAIDIQSELAASNDALDEDSRMQFRIGVNVGDVMVKEGDIFGDGVNIAARLEGLAKPGGICISRGIHDHVAKKLPYDFEDLGERSVKNIAQPIRVFHMILDGPKSEQTPGAVARRLELPASEPAAIGDIPSLSESAPLSAAPDAQSVEIEFWDSIKNSVRAQEYEAYLEQYPEGSLRRACPGPPRGDRGRRREHARSARPRDRAGVLGVRPRERQSGSDPGVCGKIPEGGIQHAGRNPPGRADARAELRPLEP